MKEYRLIYVIFNIVFFSSCSNSNDGNTKENILQKSLISYSIDNGDSILKRNYTGEQPREIYPIKNGKANGKYMSFYENGNIKEQGLLIDSVKNGTWKNYDSSENLENVYYYFNGKKTYELDKNDYLFTPLVNKEEGFSIQIPTEWELKTNYENTLFVAKKRKVDSVRFSPNINLTKSKIPQGVSFEEAVEKGVRTLLLQVPNAKIIQDKKIMINQKAIRKIVYLFETSGIKLGAVVAWISDENNGCIYTFTGMAINENKGEIVKYKELFEELITSLRLNQPKEIKKI